MPTSSTTLEILVKLKDEATAAMQGLGSNLQSIGQSMSSVGKTMTTDITLPLVAFATYAVKGAMDFQQAMTMIQTQAGGSAADVQNLSQQVMALAQSSQQGPTELAKGLFHIVSLGLKGQDAMNALKAASEGAAVGQANLEDVATALGGAISSGIKGTSDYQGTMAVLNATVGAGNMKMTDLVAALGTGILPAAKSAGLSIQDVSAALATMTDNGIPAEDAATRLRMTFSLMSAPTTAAEKALKSVGISSTELATDMRQPNGLLNAIMDLKTHLEDSGKTAVEQNAIIAKAFGGGRTSSAILTLLEETDRLKSKYADLATGVNSFGSDVQAQNETWNGQLALLNSNFQIFRDTVGKSLLQIANQVFPIVINALQDLVHWWNNLSPGVQKAIIYFGVFVAAVGPVLVVVGTLISAIGTIITVIGPLVAAIGAVIVALGVWPILIGVIVAAVVYLIVTHWTQIQQATEKAWKYVTDNVNAALQILQGVIAAVLTAIQTTWNAVWGGISGFFIGVWDGIKSALESAISFVMGQLNNLFGFVGGIANKIMAPIQGIGNFISGIAQTAGKIGGAVGGAISSVIPKLASGGIVSSPTLALVGEAGPEAVIPLSAFSGGSSLARGYGGGASGNIVVNVNGGMYLDRQAATLIGNEIAKLIGRQLKLKNYS
ncbi:MAG TPA: phage tail tape measure protein [Patescibacteria group bacterium]|nr:phage tail tape measure protein [Patescibacteria group bacterium]